VKWAGTLSEGGITGVTLAQDLVDLGIITDFSNWNAFIQAGGKLFVNGYEVTVGTTPIQPNDPIRLLKPGISYGNSGAHYPFDPETGKILLFEGPFEGFPPGFAQMVLPFITTSTVHPSFSWSQLTAEGGELYVNGAIVTSGSFMIQPGDWVKVLIPVSALVTPSPFFDVGPVYADSHLVSR
jgi:hypothetical protein